MPAITRRPRAAARSRRLAHLHDVQQAVEDRLFEVEAAFLAANA